VRLLQFPSVQSGQCYKDDHVDLAKQSHHLHLIQPDSGRKHSRARYFKHEICPVVTIFHKKLSLNFKPTFSQNVSFGARVDLL